MHLVATAKVTHWQSSAFWGHFLKINENCNRLDIEWGDFRRWVSGKQKKITYWSKTIPTVLLRFYREYHATLHDRRTASSLRSLQNCDQKFRNIQSKAKRQNTLGANSAKVMQHSMVALRRNANSLNTHTLESLYNHTSQRRSQMASWLDASS